MVSMVLPLLDGSAHSRLGHRADSKVGSVHTPCRPDKGELYGRGFDMPSQATTGATAVGVESEDLEQHSNAAYRAIDAISSIIIPAFINASIVIPFQQGAHGSFMIAM